MVVSGFLYCPRLCDKFHRFGYFNPGLKTFIFHKVLWYLSEKLLPKHTNIMPLSLMMTVSVQWLTENITKQLHKTQEEK